MVMTREETRCPDTLMLRWPLAQLVMAGLDPAIQLLRETADRLMNWMAASGAAMTKGGSFSLSPKMRGTGLTVMAVF
jgi:hypothetical protein